MPTYFDSSVVLSYLISDSNRFKASELWNSHPKKMSSILLHAECLTVLRRLPKRPGKKIPQKWVDEKVEELDELIKQVELIPIDDSVLQALRNEPLTAECKSLDALHLASALVFKQKAPPDFAFCTIDANLALIATKLGFNVGKSP